jgi:hypothetical protein
MPIDLIISLNFSKLRFLKYRMNYVTTFLQSSNQVRTSSITSQFLGHWQIWFYSKFILSTRKVPCLVAIAGHSWSNPRLAVPD